jgi:AcrR family transcriptional regulator
MGTTPRIASTKERILDAAEQLFGERGFAGTSLRAVTEAAAVNVAAVNYHFGSKAGLLRAVVSRAMTPVNDDRARRLDELEGREVKPTVAELIRAFVEPGVGLVPRHGARGEYVARFVGRVIFEPEPEIRLLFAAEVVPVEGRYLEALVRALPQLPPDEVVFRYRAMVGLLALHQAGTLTDLHPVDRAEHTRGDDVARLTRLITGAFTAPVG